MRYIVGGYINCCSHGTTGQKFLKRIELDLAFDLVALPPESPGHVSVGTGVRVLRETLSLPSHAHISIILHNQDVESTWNAHIILSSEHCVPWLLQKQCGMLLLYGSKG